MAKEWRIFHYDPDSGRSTPVEEVRLNSGDLIVVPVQLNERGEKAEPTEPDSGNKANSSKQS